MPDERENWIREELQKIPVVVTGVTDAQLKALAVGVAFRATELGVIMRRAHEAEPLPGTEQSMARALLAALRQGFERHGPEWFNGTPGRGGVTDTDAD